MRPVIVPWVNICMAAPVSPVDASGPVTAAIPISTYPMWLMLLKAISRFRSVCLMVTTAP